MVGDRQIELYCAPCQGCPQAQEYTTAAVSRRHKGSLQLPVELGGTLIRVLGRYQVELTCGTDHVKYSGPEHLRVSNIVGSGRLARGHLSANGGIGNL